MSRIEFEAWTNGSLWYAKYFPRDFDARPIYGGPFDDREAAMAWVDEQRNDDAE